MTHRAGFTYFFYPPNPLPTRSVPLTKVNFFMVSADHQTHSISHTLETAMPEKSPHEQCRVVRAHFQVHQAIRGMT